MDGATGRPQPLGMTLVEPAQPRRYSGRHLCAFLLLLPFIAALVYLIAAHAPDFLLKLRAANWPTTPGVIESSTVRHSTGKTAGSPYQADVTYSFTAWGSTQQSTAISPLTQYDWGEARAREVCERYPVGSSVTVSYNPSSPGQAMLEPCFDWSVAARLLLLTPLLVFIAAGLSWWFILLRRRFSGCAPAGLKVVAATLPRLRTIWPPPAFGGAWSGSVVCCVVMAPGLVVGGSLLHPIFLFGSLAALALVWLACWAMLREANRRGLTDIIIDPQHQLIIWPSPVALANTRPFADGQFLCLSSNLRNSSPWDFILRTIDRLWGATGIAPNLRKRHNILPRMHLVALASPGQGEDPAPGYETLYSHPSAADVLEVASWLAEHTNMPIYSQPGTD